MIFLTRLAIAKILSKDLGGTSKNLNRHYSKFSETYPLNDEKSVHDSTHNMPDKLNSKKKSQEEGKLNLRCISLSTHFRNQRYEAAPASAGSAQDQHRINPD